MRRRMLFNVFFIFFMGYSLWLVYVYIPAIVFTGTLDEYSLNEYHILRRLNDSADISSGFKKRKTSSAGKNTGKKRNQIGSFRPSFSLETKKYVRVEDVSSYNEFEYEHFNITPPLFAREEDREMFYRFKTGLDLLDPIPYIKLRGVVEVIRNGSYSTLVECGWSGNYSHMHNAEPREGSIHFKKVCPIFTPEGHTFQHFTDGLLPKLIQVRDILLDPEMKVLIPIPRTNDRSYITEVLERIGLSKEQIVLSNGRHFTADWMLASCITPPLHPVLWKTARALLGVHEFLTVPQNEAYIMLLTRVHNYNGGRNLLNHQAVVDLLYQRYGQTRVVVFKGGYSLKDAVDLFGRTRLIIGVHGGALYNLNFAPHDSTILELMPYLNNSYPDGLATTIFWSMCNLIGQSIWRIYLSSRSLENNLILDKELLEKTLSLIDNK